MTMHGKARGEGTAEAVPNLEARDSRLEQTHAISLYLGTAVTLQGQAGADALVCETIGRLRFNKAGGRELLVSKLIFPITARHYPGHGTTPNIDSKLDYSINAP